MIINAGAVLAATVLTTGVGLITLGRLGMATATAAAAAVAAATAAAAALAAATAAAAAATAATAATAAVVTTAAAARSSLWQWLSRDLLARCTFIFPLDRCLSERAG